MKKTFLVLAVLFFLLGQVKGTSTTAASSSTCSVKAEAINVGTEMRKLDTGEEYKSNYIDLKILEVTKKGTCSIEKGQVYRAMDNYPGVLKKGDKISSDISFCCIMRLSGSVDFFLWSKLTYENGSAIRSGNNAIIEFLQSDLKPLNSDH